jgi:iron complex transport system substrate-binding protein
MASTKFRRMFVSVVPGRIFSGIGMTGISWKRRLRRFFGGLRVTEHGIDKTRSKIRSDEDVASTTGRHRPMISAMRVISLLASGTEIVCALGAGDALVGRSHECDNPEWVGKLPSCTRPAFNINMSSGQIDAEVRRRLKTGEPLYHIDGDLIRDLRPDLLITQAHCEVCAVTPGDVEKAGCSILARQVLALSAGSVAGIFDGIMSVAHAMNLPTAGEKLIAQMRSRIQAVTDAVRNKPAPTVVMLEWTDPIFSMGNWAPELVQAANGRVLLGEKGQHSRAIPWNDVLKADPDYLIIAPCGFGMERTLGEIPALEALPGWAELRAVKAGRVALADGNKYFNRSGTTIVETVEIIAEILHGDRVVRQHTGASLRYTVAGRPTSPRQPRHAAGHL